MSEAAAPSPLCGPLRCPLPSYCGLPPLLQNCDPSAPASHSMLKNFNDFINTTIGFVLPIEEVMQDSDCSHDVAAAPDLHR